MDPENQQAQTNQVIQSESLQEFSDSSAAEASVSAASIVPSSTSAEATRAAQEHRSHKNFFRLFLIASLVGLAALSAGGIFWLSRLRHAKPAAVRDVNQKYEVTNLAVDQLNSAGVQLSTGSPSEVAINGSIQVGGTLRLVPTDRPANPAVGQQYIDKSDNKLYVYNGREWLTLSSNRDLQPINTSLISVQAESAKNSKLLDSATLQGNSFNGASQLVLLDGNGYLPALNGSRLTSVDAVTLQGNSASYYTDAGNLSSGTLSDSRLSGNVALLNQSANFTSSLQQYGFDVCTTSNNCGFGGGGGVAGSGTAGTIAVWSGLGFTLTDSLLSQSGGTVNSSGNINIGSNIFSGNGSGLTNVDAATLQGNGASYYTDAGNISSGTLSDSRLSANVALLDHSQTYSGHNVFQNSSDSTAALQVQNAAGTSNLLIADTVNTRIGIGLANPSYTLDVNGDINIADPNALRIGGNIICTNLGCNAASGSGSYIQNDTALQASANFNIQSASDVTPTTQVRARALQTANLSEWQDAAGLPVASISPAGAVAAASFAATGSGFSGSGAGLTNLNASNISSGLLADSHLSGNVALLNATQVFTGTSNTFNGTVYTNAITPTAAMTIGATNQTLTLQGNSSTLIKAVSGTGLNTNTTSIGFSAASTPNRNITYVFKRDVGTSSSPLTYEVCVKGITQYFNNCLGGSGGGASTALDNLTGVAINTTLLPGVAGAVNLGSNTLPFGQISFAGTAATPASQNFTLTGNPTGQRVITIPDATGTICLTTGNCMGGGAGGGANAALSNLSDVAINTSLLPGTNNSIDLGSNSYKFKDLWLGGVIQGGASSQWIATSGGDSTTLSFATPLGGSKTIVVPAASGTMAVSASGNIALSGTGNISFTGTLPVGSGGTGAGTLVQNGVLFGNGTNAVGATAAGTNGQCLVAQTGAAPIFASCASAGSGVTLQAAYDNGNSIATSDSRDLSVTLSNTTTDPNFLVNIATGSTGKFAVQNAGTDLIKVDTAGGILANTNVTLTKRADTAATNFTQYQTVTSSNKPNIVTGSYVGDGLTDGATKTITLPTDWGKPDLVVIISHAQTNTNPSTPPCVSSTAVFRTDNMPSGKVKGLGDGGSALADNYISSVSNGSFTVTVLTNQDINPSPFITCNASIGANISGRTYSYMAVRTESGQIDRYFAYGSYTGNGNSPRTICINAGSAPACNDTYQWTPDFVMLTTGGGSGSLPVYRTSEMTGDLSIRTSEAGQPGWIQALGPGSFQVGSHSYVNQNGVPYYYFAFSEMPGNVDVGKYTGTGTPWNYTDVGFKPEFVMTKADYFFGSVDNWQATLKTATMGTNAFAVFGGYGTGLISSLDATGFTLGTSTASNDSGRTYYPFSAKSYTNTSAVNGYSAGAVYNGKFYTASKRAMTTEIFRYDGGSNYTKVSDGTAGKITGNEADAVVSSVPAMKVFDNKLFIGTDTDTAGNKAAVYYCSNGSGNCNAAADWTQVNTTAGTLDGVTTNIDGIKSMAVVGGVLYVGTYESNGAEIYRYNGGSGAAVFTKVTDGTAGKIISGDTANIDAINLANYRGMLVAGTQTGADTAGIYYSTGDSNWSLVNSTRGTFLTTSGIDDVTALAIYNGSLVFGTGDATANTAEIYRYNAPQGGATSGSNLFSKISDATAGRIDSTGSARVDTIGAMTVYNGVLLAASNSNSSDGLGTIYKFDGVSSWSKLGTQAEGTLGSTNSIDGVLFLTQYNDTLFAGSAKSGAGFLYTTAENSSMSNALRFVGSSDGSFDNIGSIAFMSADQSAGGFNNQGQFLLSHTLTTAAGAYDIAEDYQTSDDELGAGDVVAIDPGRSSGFVRRADLGQGDGLRLLGIVSTHPAFHLSQKETSNATAGSRAVPVALAGRVPVKIDPASEAIAPGDYLAASGKIGQAIKTTQTGAVIAKALESWSPGSGQATIEVFVSNTFLLPGGQPITSNVRDQIEHGLRKVSLLDAFIATGEEGLQMLKDTTFIGKVFFRSDAVFGGRLSFSDRDMAGHALIKAGAKQVKVKFTRPYDQVPIISLTPQSFAVYKIRDKDKDGFVIELEESAKRDVDFDWVALQIKDPLTSQSEPSADQSP